jgi:hypothetical protein
MAITGFVRPAEKSPFQNRLVYTAVYAVAAWLGTLSGLCGLSENELPAEPYTSCWKPAFVALVRTARLMDGMTDLSVIRSLLDKVRSLIIKSSLRNFM